MASLKDEVLAKLAEIAAPDGRPLPATGKLSEIVASDGKVFFSITVDAAQVRTWEHVRASAERAVRSIPGVQSAMVALTGERTGGGGAASAPPPRPAAAPGAARPAQAAAARPHGHGPQGHGPQPAGPAGIPGCRRHHCRRLGQGRSSESRPWRSISRSRCTT